jgi:hypothetical protein
MAVTYAFYLDAGLTQPAASLAFAQAADGTSAAATRVVWLGSPADGKKFQAASAPGTDAITVSIADSASGSGLLPAYVTLATSAAGLDTATPGAALSLGAQRLSGVANAVAIHVRVDTPALTAGTYADLSLTTNPLLESAV